MTEFYRAHDKIPAPGACDSDDEQTTDRPTHMQSRFQVKTEGAEEAFAPTQEALTDLILQVVQKSMKPLSAIAIIRLLGQRGVRTSKQEVNSILYNNQQVFSINTSVTPPTWTLTSPVQKTAKHGGRRPRKGQEDHRTYVFVDLNNCPQLADRLAPYDANAAPSSKADDPNEIAEDGTRLMGFADQQYGGRTLANTVRSPVSVVNAIAACMSKAFNYAYYATEGRASYILCTRDNIFAPYPSIYENTKIVVDWEALKLEL
jgi:hypothetical protein